VVDGYESSSAPVLSGVPQGTVLGPLLFLIFINDISADISSSIRLFADDCLLYREIRSSSDCDALQADLDKLVTWSHTWGMEFNVAKCNILTVTNKVKHSVKYRYKMEGEVVRSTSSTPYLGVTINSKLTWNDHIDGITSSSNRLIGFLWRNMHRCPSTLKERAYTTMVRPKLEYSSPVWDPCRQKHVNKLEMVQRRAARFVANKPHRRHDTTSVTDLVHQLKWQPLQQRRTNSRVTMMYRITQNMVDVPAQYHPAPKTRGESWQFQHPGSKLTSGQCWANVGW
jgi:hypothetical protein